MLIYIPLDIFLVSWGNSILSSIVAGLISVPTNSVYGLISPHTSSPAFAVVCFPVDSHSDWDEMESLCLFDLHFLLAKDVQHFPLEGRALLEFKCRGLCLLDWHSVA
jgi:hypothetical protein